MSKKKVIIPIVIILTSALAGWYYTQSNHQTEPTLYGNVDIRSVNISFRVSGRLKELTVDEGTKVTAGQVLGRIDDEPYQLAVDAAKADVMVAQSQHNLMLAGYRPEQIAQAKATVEEKKATYDYAVRNYERQSDLLKTKAISPNEFDNARTTKEQAGAAYQAANEQLTLYLNGNRKEDIERTKATLLQSKMALAQKELNLQDTVLKAPADGIILTRVVEPGTLLNSGSSVFSLSLTNPVWVRAYVDEVNLSYAQPGRDVEIYIDSQPDKPYKGKIGFVSPTAEFTPKNVETPVLRTDLVYRLRVVVLDADEALRQGMPVTIKFAK